MGLHPAQLWSRLTDRLVLVVRPEVEVEEAALSRFRAAGVQVVRGRATRVVTGADGRVAAVELDGGESLPAEVVAVGPRFRVRAEPIAETGLKPVPHLSGLGDVIETDATGATSVPGL